MLGAGSAIDKQGIYARAMEGEALNVDVSNITVEGFRHGAYWRMASGMVDNCTFIGCEKGVNINNRQSPLITGVVVSNNSFHWPENSARIKMAIEFRGGPDGQVINNTITLEDTLNNAVIGVERGWPIEEGGYNTINGLYKGNTITILGTGKAKQGIFLDRTVGNTLINNSVTGAFDIGIDLMGAPAVASQTFTKENIIMKQ